MNTIRHPFFWIPAAVLALDVAGARSAGAQPFQPNKYTDPMTKEVLEYNLVVPSGYNANADTKYPLLVCLHAANNDPNPMRTLSSDGHCWVQQLMTADGGKNPSFYMAPISQTNMSGWGDAGPNSPITQQEKFEGRLTVVVVTELLTRYKIDADRLYITGPSMGGRGTWDIVRRNPGMFAAAAPAAAPASAADAKLYLNENLWSINGENDSTAKDNEDAILAIRAAGGNPIYTELANHGHDTWRTVYPMPEFIAWVFAQRRGVPWWTHPPAAPTMIPGATLTGPAVMPPSNLGNTFPGGPAVKSDAGVGSSGADGGEPSGGAGGAGGAEPAGSGGSSSSAGGVVGETAGTLGSGGSSSMGNVSENSAASSAANPSGGLEESNGCSCSSVRQRSSYQAWGGLLLLGLFARARPRRRAPG